MSLHQVACGGEHTMVVSQQGRVYAWGRGHVGQTGLGINDTLNVPACIQTLDGQHVIQVQPTAASYIASMSYLILRHDSCKLLAR